jgi:hypothetical protein
MGNTRNTGYLQNTIKVSDAGAISFMSGSTMLATINTTGQMSGSAPVLSSSYALNADLLDGLDSTQFTLTSSFNAQTASFTAFSSSINSFSASILSYTASQNITNGTFTTTSSFAAQTASFTAFTASVNSFTASQLVLNGTYATTGSNTFAGIQTINSNLVVTGSITAQTLVVQTITSSVDFVTGSTRFGSIIGNTHVFTGSMSVSGSATFASTVVANGQVQANSIFFKNVAGNTDIGYFGSVSNWTGGATDNNMAIGSYRPDIAFFTNNTTTPSMYISGSGNIGIGTTSPAYKLDVQGTGRFTDTLTGINAVFAQSNAATVNLNSTNAASYSAFFFSENGTPKSYLEYINSAYTDSTRRNYLEVFNNVGAVSIWTNSTKALDIGTNQAATFASSVTAASFSTTGNINYTAGNGVNWYINPPANGPTIRLKYHGGSTDRSGALGWIDNSGNRYDSLTWADGNVTTPNNPAFRAYYSVNSTWAIAAGADFIFNATEYNIGSCYNTSNGRFTAPVAGVYQFNFYSIVLGAYTDAAIAFRKNGGYPASGYNIHFSPTTGNWSNIVYTTSLYLNAGDYVYMTSGAATNYHGDDWSSFSGYLVG